MEKQKPKALFLVGLPGSGKSFYSKKALAEGYVLISTDDHIERVADAIGKTYGQAFKDNIGPATSHMNQKLVSAVKAQKNIVWDQTNLSVKSRAKKLAPLLIAGYDVTAVAFEIDPVELARRLAGREKETGKVVPMGIINNMAATYERPTVSEGFVSVIVIDK